MSKYSEKLCRENKTIGDVLKKTNIVEAKIRAKYLKRKSKRRV